MTEADKKLLTLLIKHSKDNVYTGSIAKLMENLGTSKSPQDSLKALTHTAVTFKNGDNEAHAVPLLHLVLEEKGDDTIFTVHLNESYLALARGESL